MYISNSALAQIIGDKINSAIEQYALYEPLTPDTFARTKAMIDGIMHHYVQLQAIRSFVIDAYYPTHTIQIKFISHQQIEYINILVQLNNHISTYTPKEIKIFMDEVCSVL